MTGEVDEQWLSTADAAKRLSLSPSGLRDSALRSCIRHKAQPPDAVRRRPWFVWSAEDVEAILRIRRVIGCHRTIAARIVRAMREGEL